MSSTVTHTKSLLGPFLSILGVVVLILLLDIWYGVKRYDTFRDNQLRLINNQVELLAKNLSDQLNVMREQTKVFAELHGENLSRLAADPKNNSLKREIHDNLTQLLSGAIRYNITDGNGEFLLSDVMTAEDDCGEEIDEHIRSDEISRVLEIHHGTQDAHFDILVGWESSVSDGVLIVSYLPRIVSYVLSQKITGQNELYLLEGGIDGRIEFGESGDRRSLKRPIILSDDEKKRIGHAKAIPGTQWTLVEVYPEQLMSSHRHLITQEIILSSIAVIMIFSLLSWQIYRARGRAEKAENFLSSIIDNLPGVVFRAELPVDGEMKYSYISSGAEDVLGYSVDELKVNPSVLFRATHAEDFQMLYNKMQESAIKLSPLRVEYRIIKKGGEYQWVREIARPYKDPEGNIIWNGVLLDISDLKATEQKLFVHYSALEATINGILITGSKGIVEWTNPAFLRLAGYVREDVDGASISDLFDLKGEQENDIFLAIKNETGWEGELLCKHVDGNLFASDITLAPVFNDKGQIKNFIAIVRDLTEKKTLETQLLQAQKMESVGQLAAGIAHEINTPTQFVGDNVHFMKDVVDDFVDTIDELQKLEQRLVQNELDAAQAATVVHDLMEEKDVEFIVEEAPAAVAQSLEGLERIAKIVGAMKDFSHPGVDDHEQVDLNQVISTTVTISRNEWKYVSELTQDLDDDLPMVAIDSQVIGQAILNIIVNAAHAIDEKQRSLSSPTEEKGIIHISTCSDQDRVEIRIADNGPGIPEEIQQRIFEPFFTTKEVGKGSGQGLAIAYSCIVEKHHGSIDIDSVVGEGTTFIIKLPIEQKSADQST